MSEIMDALEECVHCESRLLLDKIHQIKQAIWRARFKVNVPVAPVVAAYYNLHGTTGFHSAMKDLIACLAYAAGPLSTANTLMTGPDLWNSLGWEPEALYFSLPPEPDTTEEAT